MFLNKYFSTLFLHIAIVYLLCFICMCGQLCLAQVRGTEIEYLYIVHNKDGHIVLFFGPQKLAYMTTVWT